MLQKAGIEHITVPTVEDLCVALRQGAAAILVADEALSSLNVADIEKVLKAQPRWSHLPVLIMTTGNETERFNPLGNVTLLERPLRARTIVSAVNTGLRAREHQYGLRDNLESERREVQALRESEDHYRQAAELNPQVRWTATRSGRIEDFGSRWLDLTGLTREQTQGEGWMQAIHPSDRPGMIKSWKSCLRTGEPYDHEHRIRPADGSYCWMRSRAWPRRDSAQKIVRWYGTTEDINERKQAEAKLRESEERYRTLMETVPQLVWTCLQDGSCDYLSRQWAEYTGIPEAELLALNWLGVVIHPDDAERSQQAWMDAIADRAPYDLEYRLRRHDGVYRWFKTRGKPVRDPQGNILRWVGTCTDLEEEKKAFEDRKQLLAREREARDIAELLNQVGPTLSAELDSQKLAQKITDIATQLIGAQFGALFHNVLNERGESYTLYTLSGVQREAFAGLPMPRNTHVFGPTYRGEGVVRSGDITQDPRYGKNSPYQGIPGGHLPVRSYLAAPVVSRSGEVLGGLLFGDSRAGVFTEQHEQLAHGIAAQAAIALDNANLFTQAQQAHEALEQSNSELRRANEDLNQFAFSASHDLQEPLRMVTIYSQILERKYGSQLDEQAAECLSFAVQGARRMESLIKDLLAYTQAAGGSLDEATPISASEVLEEAIGNLKGSIDENEARIEIDPLPALKVKKVHLLQLFQNLAGNAIKYRSEAPPHVHVSAERVEGMWRLCIRDNGIGIAPQYAHEIFGIFRRLHGTGGKYEGTGMGLAICQKIVERYGGRIWVESEGDGRGSTFYFTLPGA